ncbi:hypothetical protein CFOL_v3_12875 [Cephalotus follicularis]|uniref:Uncharacterized protein n=1 Tax=Cephalotus follicularis TaxID=3775 RepID=A0A1Q3BND0_CEPFO|nr:hypothetical protein CFOL_v3_12875 [Cephalotus follicularis]
MHARHRPGNGYRPHPLGMGMGMTASRISPEGSVRGHGFYNSEYRSFNRGFGQGQGQPKSYQPPAPKPRKASATVVGSSTGGSGDIFMEAGRLAAEYLVSQGLLPPSALSGKWPNGNLKDFRSQDGEESRASALTRLGNSSSDSRRRYPDDYNSKYFGKERRRGIFRGDQREYGKSVSWSDRSMVSPDMEGEDDSVSGCQEEPLAGKADGNGLQISGSSEFAPKSGEAGDAESESEKCQFLDDLGSKTSSGAGKDLSHETDDEFSKRSDDSATLSAGTGEVKYGTGNDENEKQDVMEDSPNQQCDVEGDPPSKNGTDLVTLCKFAKVPTKTRSSLSCRGSKVDSVPYNEVQNTLDIGPQRETEVLVEDASLDSTSGDMLSDKSHISKCPNPENLKAESVPSIEDVGALGAAYDVEQGKWTRFQSFPDRALIHDNEKESGQGLQILQSLSSMAKDRGEKRAIEESDTREGSKKPREWLPPMVDKAEKVLNSSNLSENRASSQDEVASAVEKLTVSVAPQSLISNPQIPNAGGEMSTEYGQEKQLFPSSFKICDLNLMEASDMNENHHSDIMLIHPSITENKKEAARVDSDLSMSNSYMSREYSRHISNVKEIEVIDLEDDSNQEEKVIDDFEKKTDTMFRSLDGFSNHAQNSGHIPEVQDQYDGLMLTEYLNAFSNSPPVPEDINPLQNEMGLPDGEEALADDDSIYMSLGEIPLSFLPAWEHPPRREYEKPF